MINNSLHMDGGIAEGERCTAFGSHENTESLYPVDTCVNSLRGFALEVLGEQK